MFSSRPTSRFARRLRSLTRLTLGGVELGLERLGAQLDAWEAQLDAPAPPSGDLSDDPAAPVVLAPDRDADLLRYALIGWLFERQRTLLAAGRRPSRLERLARSFTASLDRTPLAPIRTRLSARFDELSARGEARVAATLGRWIDLGRAEDSRSRRLAELAFSASFDESIAYLTTNPEIQQLVQSQSTGLATELVEEVRERTVSADLFLEGLLRTLLRRPPRATLPEPPDAVRRLATSIHPKPPKPPVP